MRFMIVSSQGSSTAPNGGPGGMMQILDMIEAQNAQEAIAVFLEDNEHSEEWFTDFTCIELSGSEMIRFSR